MVKISRCQYFSLNYIFSTDAENVEYSEKFHATGSILKIKDSNDTGEQSLGIENGVKS